jgi:cell division protein FtsB
MKYGFFKVDSDVGREISKLYAQAAQALTIKYDSYFIGDLLPMIWDSASQELGNTTKLLAKMEETSASELANLKKENNGLKTEIEKLKQENASLRAKQKKK